MVRHVPAGDVVAPPAGFRVAYEVSGNASKRLCGNGCSDTEAYEKASCGSSGRDNPGEKMLRSSV